MLRLLVVTRCQKDDRSRYTPIDPVLLDYSLMTGKVFPLPLLRVNKRLKTSSAAAVGFPDCDAWRFRDLHFIRINISETVWRVLGGAAD